MNTILVIEDDAQARKLIKRILEDAGYAVTEAGDGKEGVIQFNQKPADLVITDIVMPEQEGMETIRLLRKAVPKVKIIAVSGGGRVGPEDYLLMAKKFGARQTLKKPFKREELLKAVKDVLAED